MSLKVIKTNELSLQNNSYPGRGIIQGLSPDTKHIIQLYWIMGRSENSRNRIFKQENGKLFTEFHHSSEQQEPELIIYSPMESYKHYHVVSNGDQTNTILDFLANGKTFEEALYTRKYEPDFPNLTPRISGIIDLKNPLFSYKFCILKSNNYNEHSIKNFFNYEKSTPGIGHCITTYSNNREPLPSFTGEPFPVKLFNSHSENIEYYWNLLNCDNKVAIAVKMINPKHNASTISIKNKFI